MILIEAIIIGKAFKNFCDWVDGHILFVLFFTNTD